MTENTPAARLIAITETLSDALANQRLIILGDSMASMDTEYMDQLVNELRDIAHQLHTSRCSCRK